MGALILFSIGVVCIVYPSQSTNVIQKVLSYITDRQSIRMGTPVPEEDRVIRPVFSIIIGFVILALALFAYLQSSG